MWRPNRAAMMMIWQVDRILRAGGDVQGALELGREDGGGVPRRQVVGGRA